MTSQPFRVAKAVAVAVALYGCAFGGAQEPLSPWRGYVPSGHMPPPGSCRIWFDDRPAVQQPPPGPCEILRDQVPLDAVLVYG